MRKEISQFLAFLKHEKNASPHTIACYKRDLLQLTGYLEERKVVLRGIDNVILRGFLAKLQENQNKKSTVARKLAAIRSFFQFCIKKKWLEDNPAKIVATPKQEKHVPSFLSEAEMAQFLDLPQTTQPLDLRDKAALELLYATGMRVSELAGLNLDALSFSERLVESEEREKRRGLYLSERRLRIAWPFIFEADLKSIKAKLRLKLCF